MELKSNNTVDVCGKQAFPFALSISFNDFSRGYDNKCLHDKLI